MRNVPNVPADAAFLSDLRRAPAEGQADDPDPESLCCIPHAPNYYTRQEHARCTVCGCVSCAHCLIWKPQPLGEDMPFCPWPGCGGVCEWLKQEAP